MALKSPSAKLSTTHATNACSADAAFPTQLQTFLCRLPFSTLNLSRGHHILKLGSPCCCYHMTWLCCSASTSKLPMPCDACGFDCDSHNHKSWPLGPGLGHRISAIILLLIQARLIILESCAPRVAKHVVAQHSETEPGQHSHDRGPFVQAEHARHSSKYGSEESEPWHEPYWDKNNTNNLPLLPSIMYAVCLGVNGPCTPGACVRPCVLASFW
jgi:hypothetical protein